MIKNYVLAKFIIIVLLYSFPASSRSDPSHTAVVWPKCQSRPRIYRSGDSGRNESLSPANYPKQNTLSSTHAASSIFLFIR